MLKRIREKQEFLYDVPFEISTTGSRPTRGLYTLIWLEDGASLWEQNGKLIENPRWTMDLNNYWHKLHSTLKPPTMNKTIEERAKDQFLDYIELLRKEPFTGWHSQAIKGYNTALTSLEKAYKTINRPLTQPTEAEGWTSVEDGLQNMNKEKLVHVFKKVSLIDLSECSFEYDIDAEKKHWCNAWRNGAVVDAIIFDGNLFYMMNNNATFDRLNPMWAAYKALADLPSPPVNDNR